MNLPQRKHEYTMEERRSLKWCWGNWTVTCKTVKLGHLLTSYIKVNSTWIKDLSVRPETIKLVEENKGRTLNINCSNFLLDLSPKEKEIKAKINKRDQIKLRSFCTARETMEKTNKKTHYRMGENACKLYNQQGIND